MPPSGNKIPKCELALVRSVQEKIGAVLLSTQFLDTEEEREAIKKCLEILNSRANEILIFIQLIVKVKNELVFAKLDLERTPTSERKGSNAQRRVRWLEEKLQNLSLTCHEKCFTLEKQLAHEVLQLALCDASNSLKDVLHKTTEHSLLKSCKCDYAMTSKEVKTLEKLQKSLKKLKLSPVRKTYLSEPSTVLHSNKSIPSSQPSISSIQNDNNAGTGDYWSTEHHRFQWHNFQQSLNPLSWHGLATSDCDSFLMKREGSTENRMPKITSIVSYQQEALDQLVTKLQVMYDKVENAALSTVTNHVQKDKVLTKSSRKSLELPDLNAQVEVSAVESLHDINISKQSSEKIEFDQLAPMISLMNEEIPSANRQMFPRSPTLWCDKDVACTNIDLMQVQAKQPTNNVSLKTREKDVIDIKQPLFYNKEPETPNPFIKKAVTGIAVINRWKELSKTPDVRKTFDFKELRQKRIDDILGANGLGSDNMNIAVDAARSAGQLNNKDERLLQKLKGIVNLKKKDILTFECAKSLFLLGNFHLDALDVLTECLRTGNEKLQCDVMGCIQKAPGIRFLDKHSPVTTGLSKELLQLLFKKNMKHGRESSFMLSFESALCLAHLRVVNKDAEHLLIGMLNDDHSYKLKSQALNALVRFMNCNGDVVIDALLHQMKHSTSWKYRLQAVALFRIIGLKRIVEYGYEKAYHIFKELLWNHPDKEFRTKVANLMEVFEMRDAVCAEVLRKLEDKSELIRAEAIIAFASLKMKGEKELRMLLDIFELDPRVYVRTQVIRTFVALQWSHPRVIRALQDRQRGADDILSVEAAKALKRLKVI